MNKKIFALIGLILIIGLTQIPTVEANIFTDLWQWIIEYFSSLFGYTFQEDKNIVTFEDSEFRISGFPYVSNMIGEYQYINLTAKAKTDSYIIAVRSIYNIKGVLEKKQIANKQSSQPNITCTEKIIDEANGSWINKTCINNPVYSYEDVEEWVKINDIDVSKNRIEGFGYSYHIENLVANDTKEYRFKITGGEKPKAIRGQKGFNYGIEYDVMIMPSSLSITELSARAKEKRGILDPFQNTTCLIKMNLTVTNNDAGYTWQDESFNFSVDLSDSRWNNQNGLIVYDANANILPYRNETALTSTTDLWIGRMNISAGGNAVFEVYGDCGGPTPKYEKNETLIWYDDLNATGSVGCESINEYALSAGGTQYSCNRVGGALYLDNTADIISVVAMNKTNFPLFNKTRYVSLVGINVTSDSAGSVALADNINVAGTDDRKFVTYFENSNIDINLRYVKPVGVTTDLNATDGAEMTPTVLIQEYIMNGTDILFREDITSTSRYLMGNQSDADVVTMAGGVGLYINGIKSAGIYHIEIYSFLTDAPTVSQGAIQVQNQAPSIVELNEPLNNTNITRVPELNWSNSSDLEGDVLTYSVLVATDVVLTTASYFNSSVPETANVTQDFNLTLSNDNTYYWQVNVTDGEFSNSSEIRQFLLDINAPTLVIVNPANSTLNSVSQALDVSVDDATPDIKWYSQDNGITNTSFATAISNTTITAVEGNNTVNVWVNDSQGRENTNSTTFEIDLIVPDFNLSEPRNITYTEQIIDINWTNTTDIQSIFYEIINETDGSLAVSNTTIFVNTTQRLSNDYANYLISVCANDTAGNINCTRERFTIFVEEILNVNSTFEPSVLESSDQLFNASIQFNNYSISYLSVDLIWNNTLFPVNRQDIANDTLEVNATLTMPILDGSPSITWFWNITQNYYPANGSTYLNDSYSYTQSITTMNITLGCDFATSAEGLAINFTGVTEPNRTIFRSGSDVENDTGFQELVRYESIFSIWVTNQSVNRTFTYGTSNMTSTQVCISPANTTYQTDAHILYSSPSFDPRNYILSNSTLSNDTNYTNLFLLEIALANPILFNVADTDNNPITDAVLELQRYFVENDTFEAVAMSKTDSDGNVVLFLRKNDAWYRLLVIQDGVIKFTSEKTQINANSLNIKLIAGTFGDILDKINNTRYSLSFVNATANYELEFEEPTGTLINPCLKVIRRRGLQQDTVCDSCLIASSGSITCHIENVTGTYIATFYGSFNPEVSFASRSDDFRFEQIFSELITRDGIFAAVILIGTLAMAGLSSPVLAVSFTLVGLIISIILGFVGSLTIYGSALAIVIVGIILVIKLRS